MLDFVLFEASSDLVGEGVLGTSIFWPACPIAVSNSKTSQGKGSFCPACPAGSCTAGSQVSHSSSSASAARGAFDFVDICRSEDTTLEGAFDGEGVMLVRSRAALLRSLRIFRR